MTQSKDLASQQFGEWTVLYRVGGGKWHCKCSCGKEKDIFAFSLLSGKSKSCGCTHKLNLIGEKFGKLTVVQRLHNDMWLCQCDCGNDVTTTTGKLRSKHIKSCGCYRAECAKALKLSHGKENIRLYRVWANIKSRCYNSKLKSFHSYGARGITMCDEWRNDFQAFYDWAYANGYDENAPRGQCTIDRIDNDKGYSPNNCRWVNNKTQCNNKTNNALMTHGGKTQTLTRWAEELGFSQHLLIARRRLGWDDEKILTTPKIQRQ